jgi:cytochrome b561/polyisoprenoid-binding protein YceI
MALGNTSQTFGAVTKTFHWIIAIGIFAVIPLGLIANDLAYQIRDPNVATTDADVARAAFLFSLHKTIGITVFFAALARILWAISQPRPGLLNAGKKLEAFAAETVHWLLYGSLVLVPLTGWIHHASTTGFAPIWWPFGQTLPFVPISASLAETTATLHMLFARILGLALFLHIAGAIKHHVIDRDATLRRMLPGQVDVPELPKPSHSPLPPFAALAVWGAVLGGAGALGAFSSHAAQAPGVELQAVASDWQVEEGTLNITITQLGSKVAGSFANWTAAIQFEPRDTPGTAGAVEVTVSIGSLSLGTVTDQAMGPDFFDTETFPTATFTADILATEDGYVARGPLTIKGQELDVTMPFTLDVTDGKATMSGGLTLQRLDFGIGQSMADESSLAFAVDVTVQLTAVRTE